MNDESPTQLMDQITTKCVKLKQIANDEARSETDRREARLELKRMNEHFSTRYHQINGKKKTEPKE